VKAIALLLVLAAPAWAQRPAGDWRPLGAAEFETLVEGRTLTYAPEGGEVWGVERFEPGRRVTWARLGAECLRGRWFPDGPPEAPGICFAYEDGSGPHCFRFYRDREAILSTDLDGGNAELSLDAPPDLAAFSCEFLGS
jgi:hypothetical protein